MKCSKISSDVLLSTSNRSYMISCCCTNRAATNDYFWYWLINCTFKCWSKNSKNQEKRDVCSSCLEISLKNYYWVVKMISRISWSLILFHVFKEQLTSAPAQRSRLILFCFLIWFQWRWTLCNSQWAAVTAVTVHTIHFLLSDLILNSFWTPNQKMKKHKLCYNIGLLMMFPNDVILMTYCRWSVSKIPVVWVFIH